MSASATRRWFLVHKWTSLVCTAFLLVICITGLPLIFMSEINALIPMPSREPTLTLPGDMRAVSVDHMIGIARARFPGEMITSVNLDDDDPVTFIRMVPSFSAGQYKLLHWLKFDSRTGEVINTSEQFEQDVKASGSLHISKSVDTFLSVMVALHVDWYAKLPGQLFLGFMALLFVVAIVSGLVLYSPFMKKLPFGTVRADRSARLKWLDLHNLLAIVTLAWAIVIGTTGAINEVARPLLQHWMTTDVQAAWAPYRGHVPPEQNTLASAQAALDTARRTLPGMTIRSIVFPRPDFGSVYHYWFWANGNTPLTARLSTAVLIDAKTGELTKVLEMPWYLRMLELSRPLHFGDYGGLPLKIIWAVLDLLTICVLGSGLYLWIARRQQTKERLQKLILAHTAGAPNEVPS